MRQLTIHRHSMVVVDLVEFIDVHQHDVMRLLLKCSLEGVNDLEGSFMEAFPRATASLGGEGMMELSKKIQRAYGVVLDQFGHLASRIRTPDWVDAVYLPVGEDAFMVATSIYDAHDMRDLATTLNTSVGTTVLTAEFYMGSELTILEDFGYGEEMLLKIIDGVIAGNPVTLEQEDDEKPEGPDDLLEWLTQVRTMVHQRIFEVVYAAKVRHDVKATIKDRTCTLSFYPRWENHPL